MLPGFLLMLLLSWIYVTQGGTSAAMSAIFYGAQPAIASVVVRAVHRIGKPALIDRWLWIAAAAAAVAQISGIPFYFSLLIAGAGYVTARRGRTAIAVAMFASLVAVAILAFADIAVPPWRIASDVTVARSRSQPQHLLDLFGSGLRTGLLTFGGAYTAVPFLQHDAVVRGAWMSNDQFLDGLALSGVLPAPFIIFSTFVGYLGGGVSGALAMTAGVFLPAFSFTLVAHDWLERIVSHPGLHEFLAGITAGVIGLIAVTAVVLLRAAITDGLTLVVAAASLAVLYAWRSKISVPAVILAGGIAGWISSI
jgi:chromate transporter